ncbi:MAG TPA: 3-oxoacyl-ACP synthase, partial [Desulfobulbaceae bacterium]|nr:3-oxoacyl-ACP synthase [Desulfobulbaceae bacterium]
MNTVYIGGAGVVSSLGAGLAATERALRENRSAIRPLTVFALLQGTPLPVGQVDGLDNVGADPSLPRTHRLALLAAREAMTGAVAPPDAIVIGTTTGGIAVTEQLLRDGERDKQRYRYHGLGTVARTLAEEYNCTGPALTVSTACSSGVVAIAVAMAMLRSGTAKTVLVGGVD